MENRQTRIADREDEYRARHRKNLISPERIDPFADGKKSLIFILFLFHFYCNFNS